MWPGCWSGWASACLDGRRLDAVHGTQYLVPIFGAFHPGREASDQRHLLAGVVPGRAFAQIGGDEPPDQVRVREVVGPQAAVPGLGLQPEGQAYAYCSFGCRRSRYVSMIQPLRSRASARSRSIRGAASARGPEARISSGVPM